jgi:hypothetical protein
MMSIHYLKLDNFIYNNKSTDTNNNKNTYKYFINFLLLISEDKGTYFSSLKLVSYLENSPATKNFF